MEIANLVGFVLVLFLYLAAEVAGQVNWGKKVSCFKRAGTILCPGCNDRAGLQCPRRPEDRPEFASCEAERIPSFWDRKPFPTTEGPDIWTTKTFPTRGSPDTWTTKTFPKEGVPAFWTTKTFPKEGVPAVWTRNPFPKERVPAVWTRNPFPREGVPAVWTTKSFPTRGNPATDYAVTDEFSTEPAIWTSTHLTPPIRLFLYSYFKDRYGWRIPRSIDEGKDTREICESNADCPCPLICCNQGKECPKRCIMGLKMHPHFG